MPPDTDEIEVPTGAGNPPAGAEEAAANPPAATGGEGAAQAAGEESEGGGAPGSPPAPKDPTAWKDKRIGKLTARQADLVRELEAAKQRLQELESSAPKPGEASGLTEAEVERRAQERAVVLAAQEQFNRDCLAVAKQGRGKFEDFDSRVNELGKLVDRNDRESVQSYAGLVAAAIKTGNGPEILHQLGGDLDEAERILGLPPVDQALALGKLVSQGGERVSAAPEPIKRVSNRGVSGSEISASDPSRADKLSTAEWMKRREAELAARRSA